MMIVWMLFFLYILYKFWKFIFYLNLNINLFDKYDYNEIMLFYVLVKYILCSMFLVWKNYNKKVFWYLYYDEY